MRSVKLVCLSAGTDFYDVYTGVGARRIRETFEMLRNFAPAVLFIDEFDALGAARGAAAAGDESASIINEMLVQVGCCYCSCCYGWCPYMDRMEMYQTLGAKQG
jgi:AAA+ superfamily predicted ATPase